MELDNKYKLYIITEIVDKTIKKANGSTLGIDSKQLIGWSCLEKGISIENIPNSEIKGLLKLIAEAGIPPDETDLEKDVSTKYTLLMFKKYEKQSATYEPLIALNATDVNYKDYEFIPEHESIPRKAVA